MLDAPTSTRHESAAQDYATAAPVPRLRGGLPILGHTVGFMRDLTGLLQRARDEVGEVAGIDVLGRRIVLVTGPKGQEAVFRAKDDVLSPKAAYKLMIPIFGKGVVYDCEDDRMNEQLAMLLPALQNKRMRTYSDIIASEVQQSVASWGDRGVVDVYEFMQTLTNFASSHCLLGAEFRNEMSEEFSRIYHTLERSIVPLAFLNPYLPTPTFRRRDKARERLGRMVAEIVKRRRANGHVGEDFMQTLMESSYADGSKLSDHEITGLLVSGMFAGHHTSSVTAAWAILELLQHPEILREARAEIDRLYGAGQRMDFESLRALEKTEWVVKEVLRLHPPLFILIRTALQDTTVLGYKIPKGTWVAVSPSVGHRIEAVFQKANSFCPHRYAPPNPEDRQPFAYIAFGGGRHKCLGNAFAMLQVKTILAYLLLNYDFQLYGDKIQPDFQGLVIGPKSPIRIVYRRRGVATAVQPMTPKGTTGSPVVEVRSEAGPFRIVIDSDLCQGHGVCEGELPELMKLENDRAKLLHETAEPHLRAKAEAACRHCPQQALRIEDIS